MLRVFSLSPCEGKRRTTKCTVCNTIRIEKPNAMLLRPFDLGDRIIITGSETTENPGTASSWFVEGKSHYSVQRFATMT